LVPKRRKIIATLGCVISQKSADVIHLVSGACNHACGETRVHFRPLFSCCKLLIHDYVIIGVPLRELTAMGYCFYITFYKSFKLCIDASCNTIRLGIRDWRIISTELLIIKWAPIINILAQYPFINVQCQVHISSMSSHSQAAYGYVKRDTYNCVRNIIKKLTDVRVCLYPVYRMQDKITESKYVFNRLIMWRISDVWERQIQIKIACRKKLKTG